MIDHLEPVVDFLETPQPVQVVDFIAEEERKRNPPSHCTCEHTLMVHARKNIGTGIWTHKQGPCHMAGCLCEEATPKEG